MKYIEEIIGWYGMVAIVGAYALLSFNLIISESLVYQVLNLTGAFGIIYVSYRKKVFQSVFLNVFWAVIAFIAIINILK